MAEKTKVGLLVGVFLLAYFLPLEDGRLQRAFLEGLFLLQDYARQHVLYSLVPAFFIAGAVGVFVSQGAMLRYLGAGAPRGVAYGVASVSGSILTVCSCSVLPLFAGIYKRGAGLGPATAFLYSGPAINLLAIILTTRVLGLQLGVVRAVGAVLFAVVIGLAMAVIFQRQEAVRGEGGVDPFVYRPAVAGRSGWQDAAFLAAMMAILVFATWESPGQAGGWAALIGQIRWPLVVALAAGLAWMMWRWYRRAELASWLRSTWGFAQEIMPLLFAGVLVSGWLLGRPGEDAGLLPAFWVAAAVGGNTLSANFLAAVLGAFMYFATCTEVPILQTLLGAGMGQGPALALLLAGPALSLPNMLVLNSYLGWKKTLVYCALVVVLATSAGFTYGLLTG